MDRTARELLHLQQPKSRELLLAPNLHAQLREAIIDVSEQIYEHKNVFRSVEIRGFLFHSLALSPQLAEKIGHPYQRLDLHLNYMPSVVEQAESLIDIQIALHGPQRRTIIELDELGSFDLCFDAAIEQTHRPATHPETMPKLTATDVIELLYELSGHKQRHYASLTHFTQMQPVAAIECLVERLRDCQLYVVSEEVEKIDEQMRTNLSLRRTTTTKQNQDVTEYRLVAVSNFSVTTSSQQLAEIERTQTYQFHPSGEYDETETIASIELLIDNQHNFGTADEQWFQKLTNHEIASQEEVFVDQMQAVLRMLVR